jgi:hypothetical protein
LISEAHHLIGAISPLCDRNARTTGTL